MKYCSKCILTDKFFSVKINEDGLCNYCAMEEKLPEEIKKVEEVTLPPNKGNYDIVLAYSGGKDSTYTLYLLKKKYKVNVLAVTFDNGFLSEETYQNIRNVCANLDVDSLIISPSTKKLNPIFKLALKDDKLPKKSLERASSICTYCIGLVKMNVYKEAMMRKIPYIAFGWTPGQINMKKQVVKLDYSMLRANFAHMRNNIVDKLGGDYNSILLTDEVINENKDNIPSLFYPFIDDDYDESQILDKISEYGWVRPKNTDDNSTNCLLNAYAIAKHKEKYGFHPYALELAGLVRSGALDREEAMNRIMKEDNQEVLDFVERKLNTDCIE